MWLIRKIRVRRNIAVRFRGIREATAPSIRIVGFSEWVRYCICQHTDNTNRVSSPWAATVRVAFYCLQIVCLDAFDLNLFAGTVPGAPRSSSAIGRISP
jgi:hypothetical protein